MMDYTHDSSRSGHRMTESMESQRETYNERLSRIRRLADVKRGVEYSRIVDNMAASKWNAHGGISLRNTLDGYPLRRNNGIPSLQTAARKPLTNGQVAHSPGVILTPVPGSNRRMQVANYNTWGSRTSQLDRKLVPGEKPSIISRRGLVMSRAVGLRSQDSPLKTKTNFRSRNGTIRIVEPLYPEPQQTQPEVINDEFDPSEIEREQTYAMLRRIDGILHPNKVFFKSQLSTSEEEILSGDGFSSDGRFSDGFNQRTALETFTRGANMKKRRSRTNRKDSKHSIGPQGYLLASAELDAYRKCEIWINRCPSFL